MPKMTNRELLALVDAEFSSAMGAPGGDISSERTKAWKYYLSEELGNEVEGQSSVVTSDVADVVDGIMPSLLRMFTTADNLVTFDPVGPEDVPLAEQESDYVSYIFFKQNPAFMIMYTWFFDALVQKNGIVKAWREEVEKVTTESYSGLTQEQLFSLLADEELDPIERSESTDTQTGETLHDVKLQRTCKEGRFVVENVPPDEYRISSDARTLDPSSARMVGQEREIKRADLLAMGFDAKVVGDLPAAGSSSKSDEQAARKNKIDDFKTGSSDKSQDLILVREAYIKVDYEGKGKPELRMVTTAGSEVLDNVPADRQPFHVISPQPMPHKHFGRATAEKIIDVQEVTTTLTRQTLDNLYHTNNPGHGIWEQGISDNTMDDLLTRRVGGVTRFARPVAESYAPMTVPFTAGASFPMLEYFDKVKRDRTGVHADSEGLSPDSLKNIQTSVMGQSMDLSRMKIDAIARIFAETGIKSLFQHLHELVLKHQDKKQVVKMRNTWVEVDPTSWRERYDVTVNIGLGIGSRDQNRMNLQEIKMLQGEIVAQGGMGLLVSPQNIYNTASEFVKNANLKDPSLFFTNPQNQPAPQQQDPAEELAKLQAQLQQRQQELDAKDLQLKEQKLMMEAEIAAAKLHETKEKREDDLLIAMEGLRNEVAEMRLKYSGDNQPVTRKKYDPATGNIG